MSGKISSARTAFGLLCGLAICCSVMYITSDGEAVDSVLAAAPKGGPSSVQSTDVQKAGTIFTNTPDGRMRLVDYFANVEKEIAAEEAARKRDVAAVRAQMARNFAFNMAARKKLKAAMLAKMAANAKKAHEDLVVSMRHVQQQFAKAAALANKRNSANIKRSAALRKTIAANKKAAAKNLRVAVLAQQRAMATLKAKMNHRIDQTNKNVAQNAAQIKSNAKAARKALEGAVNKFDKKLNNASELAKKGRSKLAAQLQKQDKAVRAWASNRLKAVAASTAAQFRSTRKTMAKDRHHADMMLKSATSRMEASLNAFKALNDKRFAKTVADIATAKKEAIAKVKAAQTGFKMGIFKLSSEVKKQVAMTNSRITQLSGVVEKNRLEQAKVNANVNAEMKRMIKLGNDRYKEHLKKDHELKSLIDKNKAETNARMDAMAAKYKHEIGKVRATMKKNRAHATSRLKKATSAIYAAIEKQTIAQKAVNAKLAKQTRDAKLAIEDSLRAAKVSFGKRVAGLHATIIRNDKKFSGKIKKLTGVVTANAVKDAKGRQMLKEMADANKKEMLAAVSGAVHAGEKRMMSVQAKIKDMSAKTKSSMNMRITSQISKLASHIHSGIEGLRLNSASARAEMKKEMLYAVRSAAAQAKKNLAAVVRMTKGKFSALEKAEAAAAKKSAGARAAIAAKLAASKKTATRALTDAVSGLNRAMIALKSETQGKIKKTNKSLDAYAKRMSKNAAAVDAAMKANVNALTSKINAARKAAKAATKAANSKSAARAAHVLKALKASMVMARAASKTKFAKVYKKLAANRARADLMLGAAVNGVNDGLAKQAALEDARFKKTVKNINAAQAQAAAQVAQARKDFTTSYNGVTAIMKDQETRLSGEIAVVSGEVISQKANQVRVNRRVGAELRRVVALANKRYSDSKRARGKLRALLNENKRAAAEEVASLARSTQRAVTAIRSQSARNARDAAKDLTKATTGMYAKMASIQLKQSMTNAALKKNIGKYSAKAAAALAGAKKNFGARLSVLTNTVTANFKKTKSLLVGLTGVVDQHAKNSKADRALIRKQRAALEADLNKKLVRAIQIGEAKAKRVADRAREHLAASKKALLVEISERVEATADKLFKTIQGNHQKIADNYLSLKAYSHAAANGVKAYIAKGKGRNLSSLGDLLQSISSLAAIKNKKEEGLGAGGKGVPPIFAGKQVPTPGTMTKINALVNEYINVVTQVRRRWPMGLGKYLLMKTEESMQGKGVLQVDKLSDHAGNFVFVNGRAVGLSNRLNDFEKLAVRLNKYEAALAALTAKMAKKHAKKGPKINYVKGPEWPGN